MLSKLFRHTQKCCRVSPRIFYLLALLLGMTANVEVFAFEVGFDLKEIKGNDCVNQNFIGQIVAENDDAEQKVSGNEAGGVYLASDALEFPSRGNEARLVGLRFNDIPIGKGATILKAHLILTARNEGDTDSIAQIFGEKSGNANVFTNNAHDLDQRPKTTRTVSWTLEPWERNKLYSSPDISPIIQEIIDETDWDIYNSFVFLLDGNKGQRDISAFRAGPSSAAKLLIQVKGYWGESQGELMKSYTLTVNKQGTGKITGQGLLCGSDCSENYTANTQVILTAIPSENELFGGWSGACSCLETSCQVTMNQAKNVTATFTLKNYALFVSKKGTGNGSVTGQGIDCGSDCTENHNANTAVILTATPLPNSSFVGWSGACSGTVNCQITMNQAQNVTATFNVCPCAPPTNQCVDQITPTTLSHGSDIETGNVTVSAPANCQWTAVSHKPWININNSSGQGSGSLIYSVGPNRSLQARSGTLSIAGKKVTVNQDKGVCSYSITPTSHTHSANAETGNVSVITSLKQCQWTARSNNVSFLTINTNLPIQGAGTVIYEMTANTSSENRQGTLTVAGQTFTVNQGTACCTSSVPVFTFIPTQGTPPLTVIADGRESYDREGIIKTYAWTTSDGQTASTPRAAFTFTKVGNYNITLTVTNEKDLSASKTATVRVIPASTRLSNLSTRARIQGGAGDIIAGFGITGAGTQKILLRGRSLEAGVDPQLLLQKYPTQEVLGSNNDWQQDSRHLEIPNYMRPLNATDAALLRDLPKGYYTVQLSSLAAKALGIVEFILVPQTPTPANKLFNISTRALVQGGAYDIIAGFIIEGEGLQKVVIRGTAVDAGVDPVLILQEFGKTEVMAQNNNWLDDPRALEIPPHLQPSKPTDAALLLSLPKGAYTVILTSLGAKKLGLIEVVAVD